MKTTEAIRNEDDEERRHNMLKGIAAQLDEHFDSVLIIATANAAGSGSYLQFASRGNEYASIAAAERWLSKRKHEWLHP